MYSFHWHIKTQILKVNQPLRNSVLSYRCEKMVDILGRYKLDKDENSAQYFREMGLSEEGIKPVTQPGFILDVHEEGGWYIYKISNGPNLAFPNSDREFEEPLFKGVKATCRHEGKTITMISKLTDGRTSTRIYEFSEEGIKVVMTVGDVICNRFFTRQLQFLQSQKVSRTL